MKVIELSPTDARYRSESIVVDPEGDYTPKELVLELMGGDYVITKALITDDGYVAATMRAFGLTKCFMNEQLPPGHKLLAFAELLPED